MCMVSWQQLFDLQKSQGNDLLDRAPNTTLPINVDKKMPNRKPPSQVIHMVPGVRSK